MQENLFKHTPLRCANDYNLWCKSKTLYLLNIGEQIMSSMPKFNSHITSYPGSNNFNGRFIEHVGITYSALDCMSSKKLYGALWNPFYHIIIKVILHGASTDGLMDLYKWSWKSSPIILHPFLDHTCNINRHRNFILTVFPHVSHPSYFYKLGWNSTTKPSPLPWAM